ncbi:MAG: tRNA uridine-5-carboxymethylaminomethyl(34) synthesis enzyme MnmG, partial [Oscillospiraceae bacterium]|nr:tRNA uridine-5-carboxymethylaminomethyl(34) synthesis enzyme MnmG [Oscillospiraceae bacterium]
LEGCGVGASAALNELLQSRGSAPVHSSARMVDLLRRPELDYKCLAPFDPDRPSLPPEVCSQVEIRVKYQGYLARQEKQIAEFAKAEARLLPETVDYHHIEGLRLEARQKLSEIRPRSIGQASRISGVSPSDIGVLLIWLGSHGESSSEH